MDILIQAFKFMIDWIYGFTGDYGVAIVIITVIIRTLMVPVSLRQRNAIKAGQEKQKENQKEMEQAAVGTAGGCLLSFLPIPVMISLYHAIRRTSAVGTATILLPWVSSLLLRDSTLILPSVTLIIQMLPQIYPYISFFKVLNFQKASIPTLLILLLSNGMFVFAIPSGLGLYYLVSGIFTAAEQFVYNLLSVRKMGVNMGI